MLSPFLNLELMHQNQIGKEIVFNEAMVKMEQLCSQMAHDFIDHPYSGLEKGLYIIKKEGDRYHNFLTYSLGEDWRYIAPSENMIIFISKRNAFFKFQQASWVQIELVAKSEISSSPITYVGISDSYIVPQEQNFCYLYINGNVTLKIKDHKSQILHLLIKQNYQRKFTIKLDHNIISPEDTLNIEVNSLALLTLVRIPEEDKYYSAVI